MEESSVQQHPEKWRDTVDPFSLPYHDFSLTKVPGYPHAGNDVFHARGIYQGRETEVYIKVARQAGANIAGEVATLVKLNWTLTPRVLDYSLDQQPFIVTEARPGQRLSQLVGDNANLQSLPYLYEYGRTLAWLHGRKGNFAPVSDRRFFHLPDKEKLSGIGFGFVYDYLRQSEPAPKNLCFCHGDFHYANLLWQNGQLSAVLDFELSGIGIREFDIAWALIVRPGQKFLKTQQEIDRFMQGYFSLERCDMTKVRYYMAQIYAWFRFLGADEQEYQEHLTIFFQSL